MEEKVKEREARELARIVSECTENDGFVIFVGVLTKKVDEEGNRILDFHYRRAQFSLEDTKQAVLKFREEYLSDREKYLKELQLDDSDNS